MSAGCHPSWERDTSERYARRQAQVLQVIVRWGRVCCHVPDGSWTCSTWRTTAGAGVLMEGRAAPGATAVLALVIWEAVVIVVMRATGIGPFDGGDHGRT